MNYYKRKSIDEIINIRAKLELAILLKRWLAKYTHCSVNNGWACGSDSFQLMDDINLPPELRRHFHGLLLFLQDNYELGMLD